MALSALALGRRLHFQHLQMLVEVAHGGTLSAAAERLHISRAAVSKALREIESALGMSLFVRRATGMHTTTEGQRVVEHAQLLLTEFGHFVDEVGNARRQAPPLLRLGMSPFIGERWAPAIMGRLAALQPRGWAPRSTLREGRLVQLLTQLLAGDIDAAVCLYSTGGAYSMDTSSLHIEPVCPEPLVVVAAPGFELPILPQPSWADLVDLPWILPPATTHLRRLFDECYAALGVVAPVPLIESSMLATNARLASVGLGLTLAPLSAVEDDLAGGRLQLIDSVTPLPETSIALIHRPASSLRLGWLDPLRQAVIEALHSARRPPLVQADPAGVAPAPGVGARSQRPNEMR